MAIYPRYCVALCLFVCLSVSPSVCPSVPLSLPSVTSFRQPLASRMYFSARTEGRISYGHLGRTNSCHIGIWYCVTVPNTTVSYGRRVIASFVCNVIYLYGCFDSTIKIIWLWLLSVWCIFWQPNMFADAIIIVSSYCVGYVTLCENM